MPRLAPALAAVTVALVVPLTGCLADDTHWFDVKVDYTVDRPPSGIGTAQVHYDGQLIETHGYTGTARVVVEQSHEPTLEICVAVGTYEVVDDESTYCKIAGCAPAPEFVPLTDHACMTVAPDDTHVLFTF